MISNCKNVEEHPLEKRVLVTNCEFHYKAKKNKEFSFFSHHFNSTKYTKREENVFKVKEYTQITFLQKTKQEAE